MPLLASIALTFILGVLPAPGAAAATFAASSPVFANGGVIPQAYTCDGAGSPPPVRWTRPPSGTTSIVVLMETVPGPPRPGEAALTGGDYSWTQFDIPASARSTTARMAGITGHNSHNGELAYAPPCSQGPGEHVYTITVLALKHRIGVTSAASADAIASAARRWAIASASFTGTVTRS